MSLLVLKNTFPDMSSLAVVKKPPPAVTLPWAFGGHSIRTTDLSSKGSRRPDACAIVSVASRKTATTKHLAGSIGEPTFLTSVSHGEENTKPDEGQVTCLKEVARPLIGGLL